MRNPGVNGDVLHVTRHENSTVGLIVRDRGENDAALAWAGTPEAAIRLAVDICRMACMVRGYHDPLEVFVNAYRDARD
jgi:hypothetical protein